MSLTSLVFPTTPEPSPAFRRAGLAYVYEPRGAEGPLGLIFRVERLKAKADEMWGLLTVRSTLPGLTDVLGPQRHNFLAGRGPLTKELLELFGPPAFQVEELREMAQKLTTHLLLAESNRAEIEELGTQDLAPEEPDLVEKLIQAGQQTLLYGPGGAGKGWLAIALALSVKYGRPFCGLNVRQCEPLYLDAEADRETFLRRVKAVGRGLGIDQPRLTRVGLVGAGSLGSNVEQLARICAERRIGLVIHDSVGRLSVQIGQHGSYEDAAKEYQDAIGLLGRGLAHLQVDHVSGEGMGKALAGKPINSVRKVFDARVMWEIRKEQDAERESQSIGLYHTKFNNTRQFSPLGLRLDFESDPYGRAIAVRFRREDVRESPELAARMSLAQQALGLLRDRALTTGELSAALGTGPRETRVMLSREVRKGNIVELHPGTVGRGHPQTWGLAEMGTGTSLKETPHVPISRMGTMGTNGNTNTGTVPISQNGRPWWTQERDEEPDDAPF